MAFPSTLEILDDNITAGQSTSARNHAWQHDDENRILNALMTKLGVDNSVDPATIDYMVRHLSAVITVDLIFDEHLNRLQDIATTATQIDGVTIQDWYLVYVKDSSDAGEIGNIYLATVVGVNVTWTFHSTPPAWSLFYANYGIVYGGNIYSSTTIIIQGGPITNPKPSDMNASNAPVDDYIIKKKAGVDQFEWIPNTWGGWNWEWNQYLVLDWTLAGWTPTKVFTDSRITDVTPYLLFWATQPVGTITKTLVNGSLTISSSNGADTLYVKVVFLDIWPSRQYIKGTAVLTGAPGVVATILDPRFDATTAWVVMPITTPVGYVTAVMSAGTLEITSTWTETWCIVNWVVFLDTVSIIDSAPYSATVQTGDLFILKDVVTGLDKSVDIDTLKTYFNTP